MIKNAFGAARKASAALFLSLALVFSLSPLLAFAMDGGVPDAGVEVADAGTTETVSTGDAVTDGIYGPAADLDLMELVNGLMMVVTQWKTGGAVLGLMALVHFLVSLSKLKMVRPFFDKKRWLRPALALLLGFALAFLGTLATGGALLPALLHGAAVALGSMGFHELLNMFNAQKQAERAVAAKMAELAKSDGDVAAKTASLKEELDKLAAIPDEAERLKALAAWAKAHPPS